jgi:L-aspartate oxidase
MTEHVGVIRNARGLETGLSVLRDIEEQAGADSMVANMAVAGQLVAGAALLRKESRGAHFRADYPAPDPTLAKRSIVTLSRVADIETRGRKAGSAALIAGLPL